MSLKSWAKAFVLNRKLYPARLRERVLLWFGWVTSAAYILIRPYLGFTFAPDRIIWTATLAEIVFVWLVVYVIQEPYEDEFEGYTAAITNIEDIGKQLSQLVGFLKQEQLRVEQSEATLRKLNDEKTALEPVVIAQRETVNAILSAYTRTTASRAWKERMFGFISGLIASMLASLAYEVLIKAR